MNNSIADKADRLFKERRDKVIKCSEWISVKDRLPEIYRSVLLFRPEDGAGEDQIWYGWRIIGENSYTDDRKIIIDSVTHWMPLPSPPEAE